MTTRTLSAEELQALGLLVQSVQPSEQLSALGVHYGNGPPRQPGRAEQLLRHLQQYMPQQTRPDYGDQYLGIRGDRRGRITVAGDEPVVNAGSDEEYMMRLHQSLNDPLEPFRIWPEMSNTMGQQPRPVRPAFNDDATWPPPRRRT